MSNSHLIVGLGGNGGKIIRELRKIVHAGRDEKSGLDVRFDYLYLDTSEDELSKKEEWKVLGTDVSLENSQYLTFHASGVRPVLGDPGAYPGMQGWIEPRAVFDFVNATTAGAAQKRKLGRLVFAQNARKFVDAIDKRVGSLESAAGKVGVIIHVACGLAGGTGSGSIVDAVAQIRHRYPDPEQYRIVIYAVVPEKNASPSKAKSAGGFSNYYANAYAALSELNAMAVGKYLPVNVLDGDRLRHDIYFNGCYLVHNVNENQVQFDIDQEVPRVVADFIYQKTLNAQWDGLSRAEKGENDVKNFETDPGAGKTRAKLFLTFGIERVVVPEQEIKEFMAYSFAEQATRQLMFNNYRQGEGFADEGVQKDWRSEVRKPEVAQALLLTDAHLMLEAGILEDDQKNTLWKPVREYWKQIAARLGPEIRADRNIDQTAWVSALQARLAKVYDETYRTLGGVAKFYETKTKARLEMAKHVSWQVEKDLFAKWRAGDASLQQQRQFLAALLEWIAERQSVFNDAVASAGAEMQKIHQRIDELTARFNSVGTLGRLLTDKRESLFADIANLQQDLLVVRTAREGRRFAAALIPFIKDELTILLGTIEEIHQKIAIATEAVVKERGAQLEDADRVYQKRFFDRSAIDKVVKSMNADEASQLARTQQVRRAIVELAGTDTDTYTRLATSVTISSLRSTLSAESGRIIELAHADLPKTVQPVLHVNIVDRLARQYDANPDALKTFVAGLFKDAGCMLRLDSGEVNRMVDGNTGGTVGPTQTIGVFLPECDMQKTFRDALAEQFQKQQPATGDTKLMTGRFPNQIAVIKVSSLMPVRFMETLRELKHHYDGLARDPMERALLHSESDGSKLAPLYARTAAEVKDASLNGPNMVAARLLEVVKQRTNKTTGLAEWIFLETVDDLPKITVLPGKQWRDVLNGEQPEQMRQAIRKAVRARIDEHYLHQERKLELDSAYKQLMRDRFAAAGDDDQDEEYAALMAMRPLFKSVIGLE